MRQMARRMRGKLDATFERVGTAIPLRLSNVPCRLSSLVRWADTSLL